VWNPTENWQPSSSFIQPVVPPSVEPDASPAVSVCFSAGWLPYVIGALNQLIQPTTWDTSDPTTLQTALDRATALQAMFGTAEACMEIRWNDGNCSVQISTDGGATWTNITGWPDPGPPDCLHPMLRVDSGGNLQITYDGGTTWTTVDGWPPPAPGNPSGASTDQAACNVATHLAVDIIQGALSSAVNSFNASLSAGVAASSIIALIPGFGPEVALTIDAAIGIVYLIYHTGSIGDYETAAADPVLAHDLQCAIYNTIKTDGAVTATNYSAVAAAIAAIGYSPSDVQAAINSFITSLGLNGMLAAQQLGGLTAGDCSGCGSGGVAIFDGTSDYLEGIGRLLNRTLSQDWTLCFWVKPDSSAGSSLGFMFAEGDAGATQPTMQAYYTFAAGIDNQKWTLDWYDSSPSFVWEREQTNGTVPWNAWHQVTIVHNGGGAYGYIIDGTVVGSTHSGSVPVSIRITDGNTYLGVCNTAGTFTEWFKGKLADVRIYYSPLTATQAEDIFLAGVDGYLPVGSPVHWWKMNDGSGSTAADSGSSPTALGWHGGGTHWSTV
jgi:hypothetical protein